MTLKASQSNTWDDKSFLHLIVFLSIFKQEVVLTLPYKLQSREPVINSSIGLDIFSAQQYLILRGLGLGELVWKHFESTKGVNVISEIAI